MEGTEHRTMEIKQMENYVIVGESKLLAMQKGKNDFCLRGHCRGLRTSAVERSKTWHGKFHSLQ